MYYRRSTFDRGRDTIAGNIWRADASGARAFTNGANDRMPRLAADGATLAFVADRDGGTRIHLVRTGGGEAWPIGSAHPKISALAWSPDGTKLAYCATAEHDVSHAHIYLDEPSGARHIRALPYKSDLDGLLDGTRQQLFVLDVASGGSERLTGEDVDVSAPAWSPDGRHIAFSSGAAASVEGGSISDIRTIDLERGAMRTLTASDGPMGLPGFSHDGRRLAFVGHRHGNDARASAELFVVSVEGGEPLSLSARFDRAIGDFLSGDLRTHGTAAPVWSADGREIYTLVSDRGACGVRAFSADGGDWRIAAGGEREIYAFSLAPGGTMAIAYATPLVPSEIATIAADGRERTLTDNNPWIAEKQAIAPERLQPIAHDSVALDGWLMRAPSKSAQLQPLVLEVHGGPHAAYGFTFFLEFQILAGHGLSVVFGNPRGSQSYGQHYASAITGDWGGIDAADVLAILDAAIARGGFDEARVGCAGGSYGGFMTSWLLGHSDRFAAGVSMRAVNDHLSLYGATDIGWFLEPEFGVRVADDAGRTFFERSPLRAAAQIDAALLILHSERDYRCPIDQGEQLFNTLRMLGKQNVEFVRFTGDGHELSRSGKPRHRVLRLRAIVRWFMRHLQSLSNGAGGAEAQAGDLFHALAGETPLDGEASRL